MIAFEVGGKKYQAQNMDVFDQLIVAKRLMPLLKNIVTPEFIAAALAARKTDGGDASSMLASIDTAKILPAIADAFYNLSDDDMRVILTKTLGVVVVQGQGGAYASLMSGHSGVMMFEDIKMPQLLQVAWKVIESQLGDFFSTAP